MRRNKKKIIIIVATVLAVSIIGSIVSVLCLRNNKPDTGIVVSNDEIETENESEYFAKIEIKIPETEAEPETEPETETEIETIELETKIEEQFTESETEISVADNRDYSDVDWCSILEQVFMAEDTEDINWDVITEILSNTLEPNQEEINTILSEIKKSDYYNYIDWEAKSIHIIGVTSNSHETETETVKPVEVSLEELKERDKEYYKNGWYTCDDKVLKAKNEWIKNNFGTSFTQNGIDFVWDSDKELYYWVYKYRKIHYMTGTDTYTTEWYYRNFYSYRIADYLGFYGKDFILYQNQDALEEFEVHVWLDDCYGATVTDQVENNDFYLKQLGWVETEPAEKGTKFWKYETPEGIPASIASDGFISIYIKDSTKDYSVKHYFTIDEYNEFVRSNTWTVHTDYSYVGFAGTSTDDWNLVIEKYIVVE